MEARRRKGDDSNADIVLLLMVNFVQEKGDQL